MNLLPPVMEDILATIDISPLIRMGVAKEVETHADEQSATAFYTNWSALEEDKKGSSLKIIPSSKA